MRVAVVTLGSRGDVQPFVALGCGLKATGYTVTLATGRDFEPLARHAGLDFVPIRGDITAALTSAEGRNLMKSRNPFTFVRNLKKTAGELLATMQEDIYSSITDADLAVFSYLCGPAVDVAEATGVPCFLGLLQPTLRTREFPSLAVPAKDYGPVINRTTHDIFQLAMWATFGRMANTWRKERFGLPRARILQRIERLEIPVLAAFSAHVVPKPADWPACAHVTGYWFLDADTGWQPPRELEAFIEAGPPPLCVTFGSTVDDESDRVMAAVKESLVRSGRRAVVVGGGAELGTEDARNPNLFGIDSVPYDWLFPRMFAVVHHGGAGTTAAALRAGVPSVVVPFYADQPFWGARVHRLGLSPRPIPKRSLSADRLTKAIDLVLQDDSMRRKAAEMAHRIDSEDGVSATISLIERYMARPALPARRV
ncbi:MAG: glycosyltransferase family 1 protein [Thermoleophilia bacterium]|nr:glycosyltransferase family 1 protein [Thermoleophilia bacterium]